MIRPIIAAIMLAGSLGLGWIAYRAMNPEQTSDPSVAVAQVRILTAAQPLQAGTLLKDADLREREVPANAVPQGSLVATEDTRAEVRGAMLRRYLDTGAMLVQGDVLRPRDRGFLAAVLAPNTRALSIGVDAKTGASGLISPGDLVDVILIQEFQGADTPAGRRVAAETVLTEARVIAVDQQIAQGAPVATPLPTNGAAPRVASTVTLQVTPEQAQRVAVAERLGRLSLSVRPIDGSLSTAQDPSTLTPARREFAAKQPPVGLSAGGPVIFGSDVSSVLNNEETGARPRVRVIQGSDITNVVFP